jgi:hypothetical protein
MIDLILHAADGQTLVQFARTYGLFRKNPDTVIRDTDPDSPTFGDVLETIDNGWRQRRGFEYSPWAGTGQFLTKNKDFRASLDVEVVQEFVPAVPRIVEVDPETFEETETQAFVPGVQAELGVRVGANLPTWVDETTMAYNGSVFVGRFLRKQGPFAVFSGAASVGDTLDFYVPVAEYLDGLVYLVRLSFDVADEDKAPEDETETGQAAKSKLVRWAKRNGTIGSMAGGALAYAEVDGVRIFQPDQINEWLETRGLPGHEWLGGNSY